ncbi:PHP domain-containing protein [Paenibacillus woosongensis]|uniref:PHP domain-containing protein n=1 Tax=Paenibacillus woosongensis TaxID=307580 RepID=A0A7X2YZL6_9BACL|nr:PHP domain-containing protein [Paenibacillus woosongensis]MUG44882.1 PHP domain-containing protein [Paenibacillus woosongensis]
MINDSVFDNLCDLHTHTRASDGMNAPAENVRLAREKGLAAIAITDHDTVAGIEEALAAGKQYGITVVPGVEISTVAAGRDIHVLGYYIDTMDERLLGRLQRLRATREARNELILEKLHALGMPLTLQEIKDGLGRPLRPDESIGRPHIADALVRKGYAENMRDAFDRYLGEGKPAYASVPRIAPGEAMQWIREAGGVPVLAHPGLYGDDELVKRIIAQGQPAGIEVYHSDHGAADEQRYLEMAEEFDLIPTAGSDYHGVRQGVIFHGDIGSRTVPLSTLELLRHRSGHAGQN